MDIFPPENLNLICEDPSSIIVDLKCLDNQKRGRWKTLVLFTCPQQVRCVVSQ